jgi:hypothetical protein
MATIAVGPTSGQQVEFTWGAFLQKLGYGDDVRDLVVDGLIDTVQRIGEMSDSLESNVASCIFQTHVYNLPLYVLDLSIRPFAVQSPRSEEAEADIGRLSE